MEGLIQSQLFSVANGTLQNFMDELDLYGFIPNGGRIYCAFSRLPLLHLLIDFILGRLGPLSTALVYSGNVAIFKLF